MHQILFHIPFTQGILPPYGLPVSSFGVILLICFAVTAMIWGPRRIAGIGLTKEKFMDMAIAIFIGGLAGARIVYMIQYSQEFPQSSFWDLILAFFKIWNGGIVFYGSVIGGVIAFLVFRHFVLRKFQISSWQLADAVAPLIATGLAIGRIGCYLNGCCWGQIACEECQVVPLPPEFGQFPILPAHSRNQVILPASPKDRLPGIHGLQTSTGFIIAEQDLKSDPRSVVNAIEPDSAAQRSGLEKGDRIIEVDGKPNSMLLKISGSKETLTAAGILATANGGTQEGNLITESESSHVLYSFKNEKEFINAAIQLQIGGYQVKATDTLWQMAANWPTGKNELSLSVQRGEEKIPITFVPRTVSFYPTQLYETISMVLLTLLLLAFQPFKRHHGQLIVVLMIGYGIHRFLNEAIRIEPTYALNLTLSQWISIGILAAAVVLETFLRMTQPKLGTLKVASHA